MRNSTDISCAALVGASPFQQCPLTRERRYRVSVGASLPNRMPNAEQHGGFVGAPLFLTPDAVRARIAILNQRFAALDLDMRTNLPATSGTSTQQNLRAAWEQFAVDWRRFASESQGTLHLLTTGTGTVNRQVDAYEAQMAAFRGELARVAPGAQLASGPFTSSNPLGPPEEQGAATTIPWWVTSLLTVAGLGAVAWLSYTGYQAWRRARETERVLREEIVPRVVEARAGIPADSVRRISRAMRGESRVPRDKTFSTRAADPEGGDPDLSRDTRDEQQARFDEAVRSILRAPRLTSTREPSAMRRDNDDSRPRSMDYRDRVGYDQRDSNDYYERERYR